MPHWNPSPFRALLALLFSFITGFLSVAHAQTESASISGTVTDPTGAVILGATVRLIEVDRGTQTDVATGSGGSYNFANVRPGHYRMEVEKTGFKLFPLAGAAVNDPCNLPEEFTLEL